MCSDDASGPHSPAAARISIIKTQRSREWIDRGFTGLKWYLPGNAADGPEGLERNLALVAAVREEVGDSIDIMVDCILSDSAGNSLLDAIRLARALEPYHPTWLEEPLNPEDLDAYARLSEQTTIPLAFGEHLYYIDQHRRALADGSPTVLQPEIMDVGGMTGLRRIADLAAAHAVPLIPHANQTGRQAVHLLLTRPPRLCPKAEWGIRINHNVQYFFKDFYQPVDGYFPLPEGPGYEIDPDKIVRRTDL